MEVSEIWKQNKTKQNKISPLPRLGLLPKLLFIRQRGLP